MLLSVTPFTSSTMVLVNAGLIVPLEHFQLRNPYRLDSLFLIELVARSSITCGPRRPPRLFRSTPR